MNSSEIAKVLNSTEDAHIKDMSTFETEEHLQALTPSPTQSPPPVVTPRIHFVSI